MTKEEIQGKVFEWVSVTAERIGDWTSKEVPEFIQEYLRWKVVENVFDALGATLILIILYNVCRQSYKFAKAKWELAVEANRSRPCDEGNGVCAIIMYVVCVIFSFIFLVRIIFFLPIDNIIEIVQIKYAPKVYLVEKAAEIVKNQK